MTFTGGWTAAITPTQKDEFQMDLGAALEVVDFLVHQGVAGIVLFGATGEFPHYTVEERQRLAHMAIKRSRVPVAINATHSNFRDVMSIVEHAADSGAVGVLVQPPHYFRYRAAEIREFYLRVLEAANGEIPVMLYNLPAFNNGIPIEVAVELLKDGSAAGIKDSSGDWAYFSALASLREDVEFPLLVGNDVLLVSGLSAGADGFISGCACAVPELLMGIEKAYRSENQDLVARLGALLDEFLRMIDGFPGPYGVREALMLRKMPVGCRAIPFSKETEAHAARFHEWFPGFLKTVTETLA